MRGRGQEDQIDLVDHVLVGVEAGVLAILGDVDAGADARALEGGQALLEPILEGVGHGDELGAAVGGEGLLGRAGAAAAAADQADLDRAAAGGMDHGNKETAGDHGCSRHGRALEEIAPRGGCGFREREMVTRRRERSLEVDQSRRDLLDHGG